MTRKDFTMETNGVFEYCLSMADEFQARLGRMSGFVGHSVTVGGAREAILRNFLKTHAPRNYHVGQGFMCDPIREGRVSRQCDILIYEQARHPLVYEDGPVKIVWPDSVRMVVEVKSTLNLDGLKSGLDNIQSMRKTSSEQEAVGLVFAFESIGMSSLAQNLNELLPSYDERHRPTAILVFEKGVVVKHRGNRRRYSIRRAVGGRDRKRGVVVAYSLLQLFTALEAPIDARDSSASLLSRFVKEYTSEESVIEC